MPQLCGNDNLCAGDIEGKKANLGAYILIHYLLMLFHNSYSARIINSIFVTAFPESGGQNKKGEEKIFQSPLLHFSSARAVSNSARAAALPAG